MRTAYVSGRVPARYERLVTKQARAARTSKSDLVARYVIEKSLETEFPGISFRDSLSGREAYMTGHRVAVWEVVAVFEETKSLQKTAAHFHWPRVLVQRALAYAKTFGEEIRGRVRCRSNWWSLPQSRARSNVSCDANTAGISCTRSPSSDSAR